MTQTRAIYLELRAENPKVRPARLIRLTRMLTAADPAWVRRSTIGGTLATIERSVHYSLKKSMVIALLGIK
jgi:hypothetical protein